MKNVFSPLCLLLAAGSAMAATVFVTPEGAGSGDGSNWANAMSSVTDAIAAATADATTASPGVVKIAKGIYYHSAYYTIPKKPVQILGGYAGVSDDEEPATAANQTIISGDVNKNDEWVRWDLHARMYNGTSTAAEVLGDVIQNDALFIPEVDGEYGIATINTGKASDNVAIFQVQDAACVISGITFVGAGQVGNKNGTAILANSSNLSVRDCRFIGCYGGEGVVQVNKSHSNRTAFKDCDFLWNLVTTRGVFRSDGSSFVVDNVKIKGSLQTGGQGSCSIFLHGGSGCVFTNCWIEKGYSAASNYGPSGGAGCESGYNTVFANCVFTNNFGYGAKASAAMNWRFSTTGKAVNMRARNCLFTDNKCVVKASKGDILNLGIVALGKTGDSLEGCTFLNNVCDSVPTGSSKLVTTAPVLISPRDGAAEADAPFRAVVNCTFSGNRVTTSAGDNGATIVAARSILVYSALTGNPLDVIIANCTFTGATAYPDIRWTGADTTYPTKVMDCIFWHSGDDSAYTSVVSDVAGAVTVNNAILNGYTALSSGITGGGLHTVDPRLGAPEFVPGMAAPVIRPGAMVPGLRGANDYVEFTDASRFYLCTDSPRSHVYSSATAAIPSGTSTLRDAVGEIRPGGASTLGAAQKLASAAENGATLVLLVSPADAGTLSGGDAIQVVTRGGATTAVTATSSDPNTYTFAGWKREDGTVYSPSATLAIDALAENLVLTASFAAPDVTYTFNLGAAGTFDATGSSTQTLTLTPGSTLTLPAYTIDEDTVIPYGWSPALPVTVGLEDAVFTFSYDEKIHRIVRVDTNLAGEGGDGSTWATAMKDIQSAIDKAAIWIGEVWIKRGVHCSGMSAADQLVMKNNVRIMGGFEGVDGQYATVDAERAARDPVAFRTVLTGDVGLDDTWKGNVSGDIKVDGVKLKVIDDNGALTVPVKGANDAYCYHATVGSNCSPIFNHASAALDDTAVLDGLTIMGGMVMDNGLSAHPKMVDCTFLGGAKFVCDDAMTFEGCTFSLWNVSEGIYIENVGIGAGSTAWTTVKDCTFTNCATTGRGAVATQNARIRISGCRFIDNYGSMNGDWNATCIGAEQNACRVYDTAFIGNVATNGTAIAIVANSDGALSNCLFVANRTMQAPGITSKGRSVNIVRTYGGALTIYDSSFISNTVSRHVTSSSDNSTAQAGIVGVKNDSYGRLFNCTFADNEAFSASEKAGVVASAATINFPGTSYGALVNCTFLDNRAFEGDVVLSDRTGTSAVRAVNTVFWNRIPGYTAAAKAGNATAEFVLVHSTAPSFTTNEAWVAFSAGCSTVDPHFQRGWADNGFLVAKRLSGASPVRRNGVDVFRDAGGSILYILDGTNYNTVAATATATATPSAPLFYLRDAFGDARPSGKFAQGAIQSTPPAGTVVSIK